MGAHDQVVDFLIAQGHGIVNIGQWRAVWYAPSACVKDCPPAWVFVPNDDGTSEEQRCEILKQALGHKMDKPEKT